MPQSAIAQSKVCKTCGVEKDVSEFYLRKPGGLHFLDCKTCSNDKKKARYHSNPEKSRALSVKHTYGLEPEKYTEMVKATPHCPICGSEEPLVVDHDHSTSEVRGLICQPCNKGLGFFRDNQQSLLNAIAYLKNEPLLQATSTEKKMDASSN